MTLGIMSTPPRSPASPASSPSPPASLPHAREIQHIYVGLQAVDTARELAPPPPPPPSNTEVSNRYDGCEDDVDVSPPPRVLREMARGTRGDGVIRPGGEGRLSRRPEAGYGKGPDGDAPPAKMRGWPPRGGENLVAEEAVSEERGWRARSGRRRGSGGRGSRAY